MHEVEKQIQLVHSDRGQNRGHVAVMITTEDYSAGVMNIFSILIQVLMTLECAQDKN